MRKKKNKRSARLYSRRAVSLIVAAGLIIGMSATVFVPAPAFAAAGAGQPAGTAVALGALSAAPAGYDSGDIDAINALIEALHPNGAVENDPDTWIGGGSSDLLVKWNTDSSKKITAISIDGGYLEATDPAPALQGDVNLSGMQALESIRISDYAQLGSLTVSNNQNLTAINCSSDRLAMLSVSDCPNLETLFCAGNQVMTSLGVNNCANITTLLCGSNLLTTLDLSSCPNLTYANCSGNRLTALNLENCQSLTSLDCSSNHLSKLDVSPCTNLTTLYCNDNLLKTLDLTNLTTLFCYNNLLTALDLTPCQDLYSLDCSGNRLTALDMTPCLLLQYLHCNNNRLTTLNLNPCPALTFFDCSGNLLATLDVTPCPLLEYLFCNNNRLTTLQVANCPELAALQCYGNLLTTLDAPDHELNLLACFGNNIQSINDLHAVKPSGVSASYLAETFITTPQNPVLTIVRAKRTGPDTATVVFKLNPLAGDKVQYGYTVQDTATGGGFTSAEALLNSLGNLTALSPGEHTLYLTGLSGNTQTLYIGAKNSYDMYYSMGKGYGTFTGALYGMTQVNLDAAGIVPGGTVPGETPGNNTVAPKVTPNGQGPQTGDSSNMALYVGTAMAAALLAAGLLLSARKRRSGQ